jgi:hypothetical protein
MMKAMNTSETSVSFYTIHGATSKNIVISVDQVTVGILILFDVILLMSCKGKPVMY